uniref:Uncharacterized protein n=1 Tax=Oryza glaberrima TaxID=4538 RepID=I1NZH8_ORYGL
MASWIWLTTSREKEGRRRSCGLAGDDMVDRPATLRERKKCEERNKRESEKVRRGRGGERREERKKERATVTTFLLIDTKVVYKLECLTLDNYSQVPLCSMVLFSTLNFF